MRKFIKSIFLLILSIGFSSSAFLNNYESNSNIKNLNVEIQKAADFEQIYEQNDAEIINNEEYPTDDVFVADIILDQEHGYDIDNTGSKSIVDVLQGAIDDLYENGGGTIYLPAGKYNINRRIDVKPFVNIRGDYRDPDTVTDGDYGTLILCKMAPSSENTGAKENVFRLQGSTGLMGLTFYYPMQFIDVYQEYAFTIEIPGGLNTNMCTVYNLENITFLNSYKGFCASITPASLSSITHEQLHVSNVKGTCLRIGAYITNASEVGTLDNITFSNHYWANAGAEFNAPDIRNINDFTKENGVGMVIGDLEWEEVSYVSLSNYHTGIYFINGTRITNYHMAHIGQYYNLLIEDCKYGIYVEYLYQNLGIEFAKCIIEGSEYAVKNSSPSSHGSLKFSFCTLDGKVGGPNIYYNGETYDEIELIEWHQGIYVKPKLELYNVKTDYNADNSGKTDTSNSIQKALDDAHSNGGGVVYLPAGFYRLDNPLTIYENTQLRGCFNTLSQCQKQNTRGTFILAYFGQDSTSSDTSTALITIDGDNAGVSGLRIGYPGLNPYEAILNKSSCPAYSYAIRGNGENNYVTNVYMPGVYNGVEMNGNNAVIKKTLGAFYHNGYKIKGNNSAIIDCLSNGASTLKPGSSLISDYDSWPIDREGHLWNHVYSLTRALCTVVIAENADNLTINHLFSFACNTFIKATNSNIVTINMGFDSQPANAGSQFDLTNSTVVCFNSLRDQCSTDGTMYINDGTSSLTVYNSMLLLPNNGGKTKANIVNNEFVALSSLGNKADDFVLTRRWTEDVEYTFISYPPVEPEGPGGPTTAPTTSTPSTPSNPSTPDTPINPDKPNNNNTIIIAVCCSVAGLLVVGSVITVLILRKKNKK